MKIGVDCRLAGQRHAGIGRYIANLVSRLPAQAPDLEFVFFFFDQDQAQEVLPNFSQLSNVSIVLAPIKHYSLSEQWQMVRIFLQQHLDLLHVPHFNVPFFYHRPLVITIHDLLWHEQRGLDVTTLAWWQYWLKYLGYRQIVKSAVKRAASILVPAETIKQTVQKYYPLSNQKIVVTKEGIDPQLTTKKSIANVRPANYLLYVGSLYPHKNLGVVFQTLSLLPEYRLKIAGVRNVFQRKTLQQIKQWQVEDRVDWLGFVPDAELAQIYQQATALIQPSLSEGFGLTGVEAMACGVPVIASDIPIFKEIYGSAAFYFNPHSPVALVKAIRELEAANRKAVIKKGQTQVKNYNWPAMVDQTIAVYRQVLRQ